MERKQDKVELSFVKNHPPECRSCEYDYVVITVPPKSLGRIKISSDQSALASKMAVQELTIRPLLKVLLNFKRKFWGDRQGLILTDLPVGQVWYPSFRGEKGEKDSNVLVAAYMWADLAVEWMDVSDAELLDITLHSLVQLHGIDIAELRSILKHKAIVKWPEAYTLLEKNRFDRLYETFERTTEPTRIHFADEHMSLLHGWIISSVIPAQQIASRIIKMSRN